MRRRSSCRGVALLALAVEDYMYLQTTDWVSHCSKGQRESRVQGRQGNWRIGELTYSSQLVPPNP
jgi:hypothetical protein